MDLVPSGPIRALIDQTVALCAASVLLITSGQALAQTQPAAQQHGIAPWTEAVVSVADLDESSAWLIADGGWRVVAGGALSREELDYWQLPSGVSAVFRKVCAAQAETGCIRFVRFDGAENQRPIRLAARPWDTGGIFSIMLRTDDAHALFDAAIARGWWAESQPYAFSFGGSDLVNVVIRGAAWRELRPVRTARPAIQRFSGRAAQPGVQHHAHGEGSASQSRVVSRRLGLQTLFDAPFTDPEPRANNFSVPANLAMTLVRRAAVVQPVLPGPMAAARMAGSS